MRLDYQDIFQTMDECHTQDWVIASSVLLDRVAIFSTNYLYRYVLHIEWNENNPYCCFILCNPSTADEIKNDATIERCERRARKWGYGGVVILNIFSYRSTNPKMLYNVIDPVGILNDRVIKTISTGSDLVIIGWGTHGKLLDRGNKVLQILRESGIKPMALRVNADGKTPSHPLYLPYSTYPFEMEDAKNN